MSTLPIRPVATRIRDQQSFPLLVLALRYLFAFFLLLTLFLGALTRLLPQMPPYLTNANEIRAWLLTETQGLPLGEWLNRLGAFTITRSIIFRGTLLLTIVLAWLHLFYALYLGLWPPRGTFVPPLSPIALQGYRLFQFSRRVDSIRQQVRAWLLGQGLIAEEHPTYQESRFFLRRGTRGAYASALFFLGVVCLWAAMYWGVTRGWMTSPVVLAPGQPWDIGHGTRIRLTLRGQGTTGNGRPGALFLVQVHGREEETTVRAISLGGSIRVDGVTVRYLEAPLGLSVSVTDRADTPVPVQTAEGGAGKEAVLLFPTSGTERIVLLPMHGLQIRVVGYNALPERGYTGPVFLVQVLSEDNPTPRLSTFVDGNADLDVDGLQVHLRLVRHAKVQAVAYPGRRGRWAGALLALLGALAAILWGPLERVWVQVFGNEHVTLVQVWGEMYNLGWHVPLRERVLTERQQE